MKECINKAFDCIESIEMQDYLKDLWENNDEQFKISDLIDVVVYAPVLLEYKIEILRGIANDYNFEDSQNAELANAYVRQCETALNERFKNTDAVYWLKDWYHNKEGVVFGDAFFTSFDSAQKYIKDLPKMDEYDYYYEGCEDSLWYTINKLMPSRSGEYNEYCKWILNYYGEIWYFDSLTEPVSKRENRLYNPLGNLNLPTPFKPGDVLVADCRPFAKKKYAVVIEKSNNYDCCALWCLYIKGKKYVYCGAFKHNRFLNKKSSAISGLYRARRIDKNDSNVNPALIEIGNAIKEKPEIGINIQTYIDKNDGGGRKNVPIDAILSFIKNK